MKSCLLKNQWELSSWLRDDLWKFIHAIDKEIEDTKNIIINYKNKQENIQLSFFDRS